MTAFDHIKCSNCANWVRWKDSNYGECVVMMGLKVDVFVDDGVVNRIETQEDFFCATFSPIPILR